MATTKQPQDATRRNVRASLKRDDALASKLAALKLRVSALERTVRALVGRQRSAE